VGKNGTSRADTSLPASPDSNPIGTVVGGDKQQGGEASSARELRVWEASLDDQAGALSRWTLSYLNPLLRLGASKVTCVSGCSVKHGRLRRKWHNSKTGATKIRLANCKKRCSCAENHVSTCPILVLARPAADTRSALRFSMTLTAVRAKTAA
jgi:hypothetical protein